MGPTIVKNVGPGVTLAWLGPPAGGSRGVGRGEMERGNEERERGRDRMDQGKEKGTVWYSVVGR